MSPSQVSITHPSRLQVQMVSEDSLLFEAFPLYLPRNGTVVAGANLKIAQLLVAKLASSVHCCQERIIQMFQDRYMVWLQSLSSCSSLQGYMRSSSTLPAAASEPCPHACLMHRTPISPLVRVLVSSLHTTPPCPAACIRGAVAAAGSGRGTNRSGMYAHKPCLLPLVSSPGTLQRPEKEDQLVGVRPLVEQDKQRVAYDVHIAWQFLC